MKHLIRLFKRDILRKIVALFFALLLYWTISERNGSEARFENIKLNISYPEGVVNTTSDDIMLEVDCSGSKRMLQSLNTSKIRAEAKVDLENYVEGRPYTLNLDESNFVLPLGMSILRVIPNSIKLNLEPIIKKDVEIKAVYNNNKLPADYQIKAVILSPNKITIEGPASIINTISEIETAEIPLDVSIRDSFDYPSKLNLPKGIIPSVNKINSHIKVEKSFAKQTYDHLPINIQFVANEKEHYNYKLKDKFVALKIYGTLSELSKINQSNINVFVDVSNIKGKGLHTVDVQCFIDNQGGIKIQEIKPSKIVVELDK